MKPMPESYNVWVLYFLQCGLQFKTVTWVSFAGVSGFKIIENYSYKNQFKILKYFGKL